MQPPSRLPASSYSQFQPVNQQPHYVYARPPNVIQQPPNVYAGPPNAVAPWRQALISGLPRLRNDPDPRSIGTLTSVEEDTDSNNSDSGDSDDPSIEKIPDTFKHLHFSSILDNESYERECVRLKEKVERVHREVKGNLDRKGDFDQKYTELNRLVKEWNEITPTRFVAAVVTLGQDADEFLEVLTIKVEARDWSARKESRKDYRLVRYLKTMARKPAGKMEHEFAGWRLDHLGTLIDEFDESGRKGAPWARQNKTRCCKSGCCGCLTAVMSGFKVSYLVQWTSLEHLIRPANLRDQIYIVKALADTGSRSKVYTTMMGRIIQKTAWEEVWWQYMFRVGSNMWLLGFLFVLAGRSHSGRYPCWLPAWFVCAACVVLSLRALVEALMEIVACVLLYGARGSMHKLGTLHTAFSVCLEVWCAWVVITIVTTGPTGAATGAAAGADAGFGFSHPVHFAFVILVKWVQVLIAFLCLDTFGDGTMLPAYHAVTHRESWTFMLVFFLLDLCFWHAYSTLPIKENLDAPKYFNDQFNLFSFMKVFRCFFLQDFDIWELEGIDPVIQGNITKGHMYGSENDGPIENDRTHWAVQCSFVLVTFTGLVFINVYIGLVGHLYDRAKNQRHQLHQWFKAGFTFRLLLVKWLVCRCRGCRHHHPSTSFQGGQIVSSDEGKWDPSADWQCGQGLPCCHRKPATDDKRDRMRKADDRASDVGCWIAYDEKSLLDEEDCEGEMEKLNECMAHVEEKIRDLAELAKVSESDADEESADSDD